jgi:hypothetical protein
MKTNKQERRIRNQLYDMGYLEAIRYIKSWLNKQGEELDKTDILHLIAEMEAL